MYIRLQMRAKVTRKSITDVLRNILDEGLKTKEKRGTARGARALLELSQIAEKRGWKGPADLSVKHNEYFIKEWKELESRKSKKA